MFHVVLVEPEIPPNTGNIGRLCLAADARLHLVGPLGFSLDDRYLRRAGMDYWPQVQVSVWANWAAFHAAHLVHDPPRHYFLTTKTDRPYFDAAFCPGDYLIFGRETRGLPESLLAAEPDRLLTIPMAPAARSLNLATAAGIVLFEALRQNRKTPAQGIGGPTPSHEGCSRPR
jgi:tRNA (cytidine/uridine-2'-O-)-methyltransferase